MKNRIVGILMCICLLLGAVPSMAAGTDVSGDFEEAAGLLNVIGVALEEFVNVQQSLTRLQFAELVAKMRSIPMKNSGGRSYFTDVPTDSFVNVMAEAGIFIGDEERRFVPDRPITMQEACGALVRAVGYEAYAKVKGGKITDYAIVAKRIGLLDKTVGTVSVTYENAVKMIYNALHLNVYEGTLYGSDGKVTYSESQNGDTVLSIYHGIRFSTGVVTDNGITSLSGASSAGRGRMIINGKSYSTAGHEFEEYIGLKVTAYYRDEQEDGSGRIIYVVPHGNEVLKIAAEDFDGLKNGALTYYSGDNTRTETLDLSEISVIYNGAAVTDGVRDAFEIVQGSISLYDNDGDCGWDVAVIGETEDVIIQSVDWESHTVYTDGSSNIKILRLFDDGKCFFSIRSAVSGEEISPNFLKQGTQISVQASKDKSRIIILAQTETISGTVESLGKSRGGKFEYAVIDGTEYELAAAFSKKYGKLEIGMSGTFTLNIYGRISSFTVEKLNSTVQGYVYQMGYEDDSIEGGVLSLRVFNENNEHLTLKCASKVRVDGETLTPLQLRNKLYKVEERFGEVITIASLKRQLIAYKLNSKGEISYIDLPAESQDAREQEGSLWLVDKTMPTRKGMRFDIAQQTFGHTYPLYAVNEKTKIFIVPSTTVEKPDERDFSVIPFKVNDLYANSTTYDVELYKTVSEHPYIETVVHVLGAEPSIGRFENVIMIKHIENVLDENGLEMPVIYGLQANSEIMVYVDANALVTRGSTDETAALSDIGEGDIISVSKNALGYVSYIKLEFDYSEDMPYWGNGLESDTYRGEGRSRRFTYGTVKDKYVSGDSSNLSLVMFGADGGDVTATYGLKSSSVMIYDARGREETAYIGSLAEVTDEASASSSAPARVFTHWSGNILKSIFFYVK